jgi:small subunit ribosomal protein S16
MGVRNTPFFRIVAADARAPRDGKFLEKLGTYNPVANKDNVKEITAHIERIRYWLSVGAQPSERASWLLGKLGIIPEAPTKRAVETAVPKSLRSESKK